MSGMWIEYRYRNKLKQKSTTVLHVSFAQQFGKMLRNFIFINTCGNKLKTSYQHLHPEIIGNQGDSLTIK